MEHDTPVAMDAEERDEFLGNGGTGVLSLSTTGEAAPHSVPVSYGYDAADETFYFRLAVGPDSEKGDLADRAVTFVTYGPDAEGTGESGGDSEQDERWHSVVAQGRLVSVDEDDVATASLAGFERVDIPLVDVFDETIRSTTFEFYRLRPERLTGRKEVRRSA
jgi:nitroimidazol reductase NimA-like FMN-containing flavoprotein (pyridoxamine 5'-phosphate oxidase superfamily)